MIEKQPPIILSIGGSLIVPESGINTQFLSNLNDFIRKHVGKGRRFFLIAGGGTTARNYIRGAKTVVGNIVDEDLDWLGIHATRLNAHLLRTIFKDIAHPRIIDNYDTKLKDWNESIAIGAGWKPGWSTDYDAVILARDYEAKMIINMSNIDWVYDHDPKTHKDAKPLEKITWSEMQNIVGGEWVPGKNVPFDPVATKLGSELGLTVIITNGEDFQNIENILENGNFKGTTITA